MHQPATTPLRWRRSRPAVRAPVPPALRHRGVRRRVRPRLGAPCGLPDSRRRRLASRPSHWDRAPGPTSAIQTVRPSSTICVRTGRAAGPEPPCLPVALGAVPGCRLARGSPVPTPRLRDRGGRRAAGPRNPRWGARGVGEDSADQHRVAACRDASPDVPLRRPGPFAGHARTMAATTRTETTSVAAAQSIGHPRHFHGRRHRGAAHSSMRPS